eukprot:8082950-Pyramimonas_sp.AAC.1
MVPFVPVCPQLVRRGERLPSEADYKGSPFVLSSKGFLSAESYIGIPFVGEDRGIPCVASHKGTSFSADCNGTSFVEDYKRISTVSPMFPISPLLP